MLRASFGIDLGRLWLAAVTDSMHPNMGSQLISQYGSQARTGSHQTPTNIFSFNSVSTGEWFSKFPLR
jgi:hypothetical protein